jgi:hypothetical protein
MLMGQAGTPAPTGFVRGWAAYAPTGGTSLTLALPSGSQAGDRLYVMTAAGWGTNLISGYSSHDNRTGSNWSGRVQSKVLTSTDISTGTVTVTFAGSYAPMVWLVATVGDKALRSIAGSRASGSDGTVNTLTTDAAPVAGDHGLFFATARGSYTFTADRGVDVTGDVHTPAANDGTLHGFKEEALPASGAVSVTFTTTATISVGDYFAVLILQP